MSPRRKPSIVETILAASPEKQPDGAALEANGSSHFVTGDEFEDGTELRDFGSLLRRRKWVIAALTLLVTATAFALTMRQTKVYSSTATVLLETPPWQSPSTSPSMATEKQVGGSVAVATIVGETLKVDISPQQLLKDLSLDVPVDTEILKFTYSNTEPAIARERADAFANAYLNFRRGELQTELVTASRSIEDRIRFLTDQLSTIERGKQTSSTSQAQATSLITQIGILQQKLANITPNQNVFPGGVLSTAVLPRSPAQPKLALNVGLGVFAGLLLGLGVAALLEYSDDRLRGPKELQNRLAAPVLSSVPVAPRRKPWTSPAARVVTLRDPESWGAEAFRQLRTNFLFAARQDRARSVLVTSAGPEEGKTYVTANLGVALAKAGKRVVVVSADLRRPTLESLFDGRTGTGLVDVLLENISLNDALRETATPHLTILEGGSRLSNPAELLGSDNAARLIARLTEQFDYVLIDASPILSVSDAGALAPACDAVLFVSDVRKTTRASVSKAAEQLRRIGAATLGAALLDPGIGRAGSPMSYRSSQISKRPIAPNGTRKGQSETEGSSYERLGS